MTRLEILQGTLDLLILRTLSGVPRHGYQIARLIKESSNDALQIEEGALYPALHRIEAKGWIMADWGVSENNRRAKFYSLTEDGRSALQAQEKGWAEYVSAVAGVLDAPAGGSS